MPLPWVVGPETQGRAIPASRMRGSWGRCGRFGIIRLMKGKGLALTSLTAFFLLGVPAHPHPPIQGSMQSLFRRNLKRHQTQPQQTSAEGFSLSTQGCCPDSARHSLWRGALPPPHSPAHLWATRRQALLGKHTFKHLNKLISNPEQPDCASGHRNDFSFC